MNRIDTIDKVFHGITKLLPKTTDDKSLERLRFSTNPEETEIRSYNRVDIEAIANLFEQLYEDNAIITGQDEQAKFFYASIT